jgi:hypothetical protein
MTSFLEAVRAGSERMTVREAVRLATAFGCERDLLDSLRGGYCPTLRTAEVPMGVAEGRLNHAVRLVRRFVHEMGRPYFDGRVVYPDADVR